MSYIQPLSSTPTYHVKKVTPMQSAQEDEQQKIEFDQTLQNAPAAHQHDKSATAAPTDTQALWADVGKGMNNLIFQDSNRINNKFQENMRSLWTEENNNSKKSR